MLSLPPQSFQIHDFRKTSANVLYRLKSHLFFLFLLPDGAYQTVFGLDVREAYRNQGIAGKLLDFLSDTAKERGKKGVILTCKEHLLKFYGSHGFDYQ